MISGIVTKARVVHKFVEIFLYRIFCVLSRVLVHQKKKSFLKRSYSNVKYEYILVTRHPAHLITKESCSKYIGRILSNKVACAVVVALYLCGLPFSVSEYCSID